MNLRDLEYLTTLARLKHFGRAAIACHVSQPTLSMQVKKLEESLGTPLLERDRRNIRLTRAGVAVVARAENILREAKALKDVARAHADPLLGSLTLGAFPTLAPFFFPKIVPALNRAHTGLRLFLVEERTAELLKRLREGKIDLALIALPVAGDDLEHAEIFEEPFLVAISAKNNLAKKKAIKLEDLRKENLLLLEDSHCLTGQALDVCTWSAAKGDNFRATSLETLRQMVASNLGVTLVPEMAAVKLSGLVYRPLEAKHAPGRKIGLFWRKSSPFAEAYRSMAKEISSAADARP